MTEAVFMFDGEDPQMRQAYENAQLSFKYFWRELSWERQRIIPGLELAAIKMPFTDGPRTDGNPAYEQMWCDDVNFDGETLSGKLLNAPNWLQSVKAGDSVRVPFAHLTDWMMAASGAAYGGFTVNLMRATMSAGERRAHDQAWGLDFGDPNHVRTEINRNAQKKPGLLGRLFGAKPAAETPNAAGDEFRDHPMCTNMLGKIEEQLSGDPSVATFVDEEGWTLLQRQALAGNLGVVQLLVKYGADPGAKTPAGHNAAALARRIGWGPVADYLERVRP